MRVHDVILLMTGSRAATDTRGCVLRMPMHMRGRHTVITCVVIPHYMNRALSLAVTIGRARVSHVLILKPPLRLLRHVPPAMYPQRHGLPSTLPVRGMHHFSTNFQTVNLLRRRNVNLVIGEQDDGDRDVERD